MAVKQHKPTSAGRRFATFSDFKEITKKKPAKALTTALNKKSGRGVYGRITTRHLGGRHKRKYRLIDFKRNKDGIEARVASIEYDPNRSSRIALLNYSDGEKRYILAPLGFKVGDKVASGEKSDIRLGNNLPLKRIPLGTAIHNVELKPGKGAQIARGAGTSAQLLAREGNYAHVKLPSGEVRMVELSCRATIGQVGNVEHEGISLGKAGRSRHLGKRPAVRGTAMNPVDHPHGGGEGKASSGRHPVTPWGKPTLGYRTRRKKPSDKMIVRPRKR